MLDLCISIGIPIRALFLILIATTTTTIGGRGLGLWIEVRFKEGVVFQGDGSQFVVNPLQFIAENLNAVKTLPQVLVIGELIQSRCACKGWQ